MEKTPKNNSSLWRIELAGEVVKPYLDQEDITMIVLGGSPSRGLADDYSDLDIIVYWNDINNTFLEQVPLRDFPCKRAYCRKMGDDDIYLESYYFGPLKVDFGHVTMAVWETMTHAVMEDLDTDGGNLKSIAGFLDAVVLYGEDLFNSWQAKLETYPEGLAERIIRQNLRFFTPGCLLHQGLERGDLLYWYDGLSMMMKNLLTILAALNKRYFSADEPRWLDYELAHMDLKPGQCLERIVRILNTRGPEGEKMMYQLIFDVFDLIERHAPDIDVSRLRKMNDHAVRACSEKPQLP